jgi:hypothetical protein
MIENHYLDRVMCQFNLYQQVSLLVLIPYEHILTYHINKHTSGGDKKPKCGLRKVLLVGTRRARAAYHGDLTAQFCRALCVHGLVL